MRISRMVFTVSISVALVVACHRSDPKPTPAAPSDSADARVATATPPAPSPPLEAACGSQRCTAEEECHYGTKGCDTPSTTCRKPFECAVASVFCGCDGKTFHDCSPPKRPYLHEGPCPTVEGSPCSSRDECSPGVCVFKAGCTPAKGKCTKGPVPSCVVANAYCGCALGTTYHACLPTLAFSRQGACP